MNDPNGIGWCGYCLTPDECDDWTLCFGESTEEKEMSGAAPDLSKDTSDIPLDYCQCEMDQGMVQQMMRGCPVHDR